MKRKLKAIGLILCITALIAAAYMGISLLIEEHITAETVCMPAVFAPELAKSQVSGVWE